MSNKLEKILRVLSETSSRTVPFDGFNPDDSNQAINDFFSSIDEEEKIKTAQHIIEHCADLQQCLHKYLFNLLEVRNETMLEEIKKEQETLVNQKTKQMTFSPSEVVKISGKVKNTIYDHLKKGKLKGHFDGTTWTIERDDLEQYLHRTDF